MTNKEALEILKTEWDINAEIFDTNFHEALDIAIKALEERPQGDLISREALKKEIQKLEKEPDYQHEGETWQNGLYEAETLIDNAPTVELQMGRMTNGTTLPLRVTSFRNGHYHRGFGKPFCRIDNVYFSLV